MFHCFTFNNLKLFLISFISMVVMDCTYLMLVASNMPKTLMPLTINESLPIEKIVLLLCIWALITSGIILFVLPRSHGLYYYGIVKGAVYGFIIYSVYELTNFIIIVEWPTDFMVYDIAWGSFLCAAVTLITLFAAHRLGYEIECDSHHGKEKHSCL